MATVVLVGCPRAEASGIITHSWMAPRGRPLVEDPALRALLLAHLDQVEGGAHFPDSGYAARASGWRRLRRGGPLAPVLQRLRRPDPDRHDCGDLTDPDGPCAGRIAHLMGAVGPRHRRRGVGLAVRAQRRRPRRAATSRPAIADRSAPAGSSCRWTWSPSGTTAGGPTPADPELAGDQPAPPGRSTAIDRSDVDAEGLRIGYVGIGVARDAEAALTRPVPRPHHRQHAVDLGAHRSPRPAACSSPPGPSPRSWENLWGRMLGDQPDTEVVA